jgi:mono/diheme cytochrome c family protein
MRHKGWLIGVIPLAVIIVIAVYGVTHMSIGALSEPGSLEVRLASWAREWFIRRGARSPLPPAPANDAASLSIGSALFGMACATCHGQDGRTPTPLGRSMYPRAPDLGTADVQDMSDAELFWVIKNGIRLSGMPGFAGINSDDQIWQLAYFVRNIGKQSKR